MLDAKPFLLFAFLAFFGSFAFAQEYEADVDSAWIASQNGGQALESEPASEEPAPACIGDGCDGTETAEATTEPATESEQNSSAEQAETTETAATDSTQTGDSTATAKADSTAQDSTKKTAAVLKITEENEDDYEDCTEADSTNTECVEVDESDTYDRYLQENAEQYRARKEGFSRSIQLGLRATGGMNTLFGKKQDGWGFGYQGGGGIMVKMPVGIRHVSLVPEIDFVYRRYNFEKSNDYSKSEAYIEYMLFEIPIIIRYTFDEDNFFVGLGMNVDLKLTGSSKFTQKMKETGEKDKRNNSLPTSGVELGGVFNLGYVINRWFVVDVRVVQCFTNLLNKNSIAESSLAGAELYTFYTTLGLTFVF
jgi:hypothetical protein